MPNKKIFWWLLAGTLLLFALYCAMAILQAGSIYGGERALSNLRFWGVLSLSSLAGSIACALLALRARRRVTPA